MAERCEAGEPIHDNSWLFRNYSVRFNGKLRRLSGSERGHAITRDSISPIVNEAAARPNKPGLRGNSRSSRSMARQINCVSPVQLRIPDVLAHTFATNVGPVNVVPATKIFLVEVETLQTVDIPNEMDQVSVPLESRC